MKRVLLLIIILIIKIKGVVAQGENLVKDGTFENVNRVNSDFKYNQWWGFGNYAITDQVVSKWGKTFVDPIGSTGRFLIVDVNASNKQRLCYDSITVKPNTTYSFTCLIANVFAPVYTNDIYAPKEYTPVIQLNVNGKRVSRAIVLYSSRNEEWKTEWKTIRGRFTSGPDQTRIEISITDKEWGLRGNDVAIDNISFAEIESTPIVVKEEPLITKEDPKPLPDTTPVIVKAPEIKDTVKTEFVNTEIKEEIIAEEKTIIPVFVKDSVIPEKVVKEETPVLVSSKTIPAEVKKPEEKKIIIAPTIEKKVISPTVTVKKKESEVPLVIAQEKKEISTPEIEKKPNLTQTTVKKKDNTPVIVKKEPEKKPEPAKPKAFLSDIKISDVKVNETLELSHIYFEKSKSHLLPTSIPELKNLTEFMKKNPTVRIRLEGHTERIGDPQKNIELSENRVKEVKKYLVENGINTDRIEWIGHGGEKPIYTGEDEEKKKLNRRVEVVIIDK